MDTESSPPGWGLCTRWVMLTTVGYAVGFLAGFVLGHLLMGNVMVGVGIGAGTGLVQWLVLRRYLPVPGSWVLISMVGLAVPLGLYAAVSAVTGFPMDLGWPLGVLGWGLAFLLGGAIIGWAQQRVLRSRGGRAPWWIPATALAWAASVLAFAIPPDMSGNLPIPLLLVRNGLMVPAVAGAILGVVTGIALRGVTRPPEAETAA